MKVYRVHFGKRLKQARKDAGLTQSKLAEMIHVEPPTVSRWESGHDFPDDKRIPDIVKALRLPADYFELVGKSDSPEPDREGFADAADFLYRFSNQPRALQLIAMAVVYNDETYLHQMPKDVLRLFGQLLTTLEKSG